MSGPGQKAASAGAWTMSACLSKADIQQPRGTSAWSHRIGGPGPPEGATSCGDRATLLIERICCEKIRGCSYGEACVRMSAMLSIATKLRSAAK